MILLYTFAKLTACIGHDAVSFIHDATKKKSTNQSSILCIGHDAVSYCLQSSMHVIAPIFFYSTFSILVFIKKN